MKRKNIIISSALAACILSSSAVVLANTTDTAPPWMNQANKYIDRMIQDKKDRLRDKTQAAVAAEVEDVYNYALKKAKTKEQIDAILALQNDKSNGIGEWKRKTLQVIGELPIQGSLKSAIQGRFVFFFACKAIRCTVYG